MSKRIYTSPKRNALALQTKERILGHAKKLFQSVGFEYVTIEKIAKTAKVSIPTVYAIFQSKRGILRTIMDQALPIKQFESLVRQAKQESDPKKHLLITAKIARQIYDAEKEYMAIFQGASVLAPEFKELEKEREQRRYQRLKLTIKVLKQKNSFRNNLNTTTAHDTLWALTGRDIYRMLVIEQKWTSEAYENWLAELLKSTLIR